MARNFNKPLNINGISSADQDEDMLNAEQQMPAQQPDNTDIDKLHQLQTEMNNSSQAAQQIIQPFGLPISQANGLRLGPADESNPNSPLNKYKQMRQLEQERLYSDPYRFARIKQMLGNK